MFNINPDEGANIFEYFRKDAVMDGEEIADEFGTTRQNVSRILKDALAKFYLKVKILNKEMTPFEVATCMMEMLGVNQRDQNEISKFFTLFPPKLKSEIERDGKRILDKYYKRKR